MIIFGLKIIITNPSARGIINSYNGSERQITSITWDNSSNPTTTSSTIYNIYGNSTLASISSKVNYANKNNRMVGDFFINTVTDDHPTLNRELNERLKIDHLNLSCYE